MGVSVPQHTSALLLLTSNFKTGSVSYSQITKLKRSDHHHHHHHGRRGSVAAVSDVVWPSAGAFAAMALLGKIDQMILAPKGMMSMSIAPLGAVSALLFITPSSPSARKYNMFMAQIGCSAIGVLAYSLLGPGWFARSAALAASIAFMILTRSIHPPAASLPILFIDAINLHNLNFWYAFFPGAAGCIILSFMQQIVSYLKDNFKF